MKKAIILLFVFVLLVSAMAGCSGKEATEDPVQKPEENESINEASDEPVDLVFMGWGNETEQEVFRALIATYEEANPNVAIEYIVVPPGEYMVKLQSMVAGGNMPDVFYLGPGDIMFWADSGKLADLSDYLNNSDVVDVNNVWQAAIERYSYDGNQLGQGALYGLPKDLGPWALTYNKDLFDAAGIDYPDPDVPLTWDEFTEIAIQLTSGEGVDKIFGTGPYTPEAAIWANGADFVDETKTKVTIDDPAFYEAIQFVADLRNVHGCAPSQEEEEALGGYQRFISGNVAMFPMGPWDQPSFWELDFEWDLMPWPASPTTGENATWVGSLGYSVASDSENMDEAYKFAEYLAFSEEGQRQTYEMGQAVPNLIDMAYGEFLEMEKAPDNRQEFIDIIEDYGQRFTNEYTYTNDWIDAFWSDIYLVWTEEMTAEEYCMSKVDEMQELLDESVEKHNEAKGN